MRSFKIIAVLTVVLAGAFGVFEAGYFMGVERAGQAEDEARLAQLMRSAAGASTMPANSQAMSDKYWRTWQAIRTSYLYQSQVTDEKLFQGSLEGMVKSLDDPYSEYMGAPEAEKWAERLSGKISGIGAIMSGKAERPTVQKVLPQSPAEQAGLRAGDTIMAIDGRDTKGVPLQDCVKRIRGDEGTKVRLGVSRSGRAEPFELTVMRGEVSIPTVELKFERRAGKKIAVLTLAHFSDVTPGQMDDAAKKIAAAHADGIILDLRDDPGGSLKAVVSVAGLWTGQMVVVSERNAAGSIKPYLSDRDAVLGQTATVVLTNGNTASASEIMTAALKELAGATVVGEKTYGKGVVQRMSVDQNDGSMLKLTTSEWLTPRGNAINKKGIEPDIAVPLSKEDLEAGRDPQLAAAFKRLTGQ